MLIVVIVAVKRWPPEGYEVCLHPQTISQGVSLNIYYLYISCVPWGLKYNMETWLVGGFKYSWLGYVCMNLQCWSWCFMEIIHDLSLSRHPSFGLIVGMCDRQNNGPPKMPISSYPAPVNMYVTWQRRIKFSERTKVANKLPLELGEELELFMWAQYDHERL